MAWTRLDDQFFANPKVIDLSKDAKLLYLSAVTYSAGQLTDGRIGPGALRTVSALVDADRACAAELVACGLWEIDGDDYLIHDYLEYNPTAAEVRAKRAADRARKRPVSNEGTDTNSARNPPRFRSDSKSPVPTPVPVPNTHAVEDSVSHETAEAPVQIAEKRTRKQPATDNQTWALVEDVCEIIGVDPSDYGGAKGRLGKVASRLLDKHPRDKLLECARWLYGNPYHRNNGIDLFVIEREYPKFLAATAPRAPIGNGYDPAKHERLETPDGPVYITR